MDDVTAKLIDQMRGRGPMTADEIEDQRRSFVRAEMGFGSDADEAAYSEALTAGDDGAIETCRRMEQWRMAVCDRFLDRDK